MDKKSNAPGRIAAKDLPPVKSWALPRVQGAHVVRSPFAEKDRKSRRDQSRVEEIPDSKPLTVEAIEKIRLQAQEEGFKQGKTEGLEQGLQEGLRKGEEQGYQQGLQQAKGEMDALRDKLTSLMQSIESPLEQQQQELESALLRLVIDTAGCVVKQELKTRPEILQQAVNEALAALPHEEPQLCFSVSPDDLALLEEIKEREHASWSLRVDKSMTSGGLSIKGANSYLDYSVENRFSQVVEQLLERNQAANNETD
ncbi:flagellar assembly protein FliH [Motiliproteus sp. MSK22-1]|uniref:flagellar assembly protein FliH n=1 Tax=Motiliproteus sp. MSK22-1 TaxID=1897630 RepID=UPI000975BB8F|nr:flagellar assembly protein FliH [Motiliproteus sp. MSK22-1]OMH30035.1 hypothetical protein BGP75_19080 [Motiliproteus sp. MSK22-1]